MNIEDEAIRDTYTRIEKALDLRFEADTSLYISKKEVDKVKSYLANNHYQNIAAMAQKFGDKVIANVILNNSWLVDCRSIKKNYKTKEMFTKLFRNLPDSFLISIVQDILHDNVYSSIEFKEFIERIYLHKINTKECQKRYQDDTEKLPNRVLCFSRYMTEDYVLNNPASQTIRYIDHEFKHTPDLEKHIPKSFLAQLFEKIQDKETLARWIVENKMDKGSDVVWTNGLLSLEQTGFFAVISYLKSNSNTNNNYKWLVKVMAKFFTRLPDKSIFEENVCRLYEGNECLNLRWTLIRMLVPANFPCKETANRLVDQFERKSIIQPKHKNLVQEIRLWNVKLQQGYKNSSEVLDEFELKNHDLTKEKTLEYFCLQLVKTDASVIKSTYFEYGQSNRNIEVILLYYFARQFIKERWIPDDISNVLPPKHIDQISQHISKMYVNTMAARRFLEKHKQTDIIDQIFER